MLEVLALMRLISNRERIMTSTLQMETITGSIIDALERGVIPWQKPWDEIPYDSRFPHNAISGKKYNGMNPFILSAVAQKNGYTSSGWLTFKQAIENGGNVTGQHPALIYFWKFNPVQSKNSETGKVTEKTVPFMQMFKVFNTEQCGAKLKLPARETSVVDVVDNGFTPNKKAQSIVDKYVKNGGASITHASHDGAYYSPLLDEIHLPDKKQFKTKNVYYATAFHEMGHSIGHSTRLNRFVDTATSAKFGSKEYSKEELVAELTSTFLCAESGINNTIENSASYIKGWLSALKNDRAMLVTASSKAQASANYILKSGVKDTK
jgi:antirestriction protein ArdC